MEVYTKVTAVAAKYNKLVIALGMFDGVHIGHQSIIKKAIAIAKEIGGTSMVFTFANHPLAELAPERKPLQIGDSGLRNKVIAELGVDVLFSVPFTRDFSQIKAEDFLKMLKDNYQPAWVVTGPNFTFGQKGKGTPKMLLRECKNYGFQAEICPAFLADGRPVSSTRIRKLIAEGNLVEVTDFLGRDFVFAGEIVHGDHRGRTIGFPTANLKIADDRAMLPNGAYAVLAEINGEKYPAITSVGTNPTFGGCKRRLETHILGFKGDIYGKRLTIYFKELLRSEKKFSSAEELVKQLNRDKEKAQLILKNV